MPFDWKNAASIGSAVTNFMGAVGDNMNEWTGRLTGHMENDAQRRYNEAQYALMRKHALEDYAMVRRDNLSDYERMNRYNDPSEVMKRLRAAGLNPHLVYGNGAVTTASPLKGSDVRASEMRSWNPAVPRMDMEVFPVGQALQGYYDTALKSAQIDLVKNNAAVANQEVMLKAVQTAKAMTEEEKTRFDVEFKREFKQDIAQKLINEVARIGAQTQLTETTTRMKEIEAGLMDLGISFRDPLFDRYIALAMENPNLKWTDLLKIIMNKSGGILKGAKGLKEITKPSKFMYKYPKW